MQGNTRSGAAWVVVGLLLALPALALSGLFSTLPAPGFDAVAAKPIASTLIWQRDLAWSQPWREFSSVWLHFSALHLAMNLLGTLGVVALGLAANVPRRAAWAWAAAWPLTQLSLLMDGRIHGYGGLSGVLHAGVAVAAVCLLTNQVDQTDRTDQGPSGPALPRWIGAALLAGLAMKIAHEAPWATAVQAAAWLDTPVVPLAHAVGAASGAVCALLAMAISVVPRSPLQRARS